MAKILLLYATTDGHTLKICEYLQQVIHQYALHKPEIILQNLSTIKNLDLTQIDKIIIGASIRYGKHQALVYQFMQAYAALLTQKITAFFSVNIVARKANKNSPYTNPYMQKFLSQLSWQPNYLAVFAGRLNYSKYNFLLRQLLRLIMWLTDGPTDITRDIEFTNWDQVTEFGKVIADL